MKIFSMKKMFALAIALIMILSFTACGGDSSDSGSSEDTGGSEATSTLSDDWGYITVHDMSIPVEKSWVELESALTGDEDSDDAATDENAFINEYIRYSLDPEGTVTDSKVAFWSFCRTTDKENTLENLQAAVENEWIMGLQNVEDMETKEYSTDYVDGVVSLFFCEMNGPAMGIMHLTNYNGVAYCNYFIVAEGEYSTYEDAIFDCIDNIQPADGKTNPFV